ncbi:hypothetical protein DDSR119_56 [Pseudomonas phage DDSR119]|nr:hypothetical protein DDSR119_56 [Pseudomonas phage DDSR119]
MTIKQTAEQLAFVEANKGDFYVTLALDNGATIEQLSDGRWMVATPEAAENPVAEVRKSLLLAAQIYCCRANLVQPI